MEVSSKESGKELSLSLSLSLSIQKVPTVLNGGLEAVVCVCVGVRVYVHVREQCIIY